MDRIKNFQDTVEHRQPEDIVMDLGGCPLSSVEGQTQARLLRYLGYDAPDDAPLLFGLRIVLPPERNEILRTIAVLPKSLFCSADNTLFSVTTSTVVPFALLIREFISFRSSVTLLGYVLISSGAFVCLRIFLSSVLLIVITALSAFASADALI